MNKPLKIFLVVLLLLLILSMSLTPLRSSNDVWWHLKTGKVLLERNFSLPENDIFAFTSQNIPWHNHEWLAQVLFFQVFRLGGDSEHDGLRFVIFFKFLVLLGACIFVVLKTWRETRGFPAAILAGMVAMLMMRRTIYPRPPILTYLFFAFYLYIFSEYAGGRLKKKWLWILPVLMIPWVNLHGGFMLGIIAAGAYFAGSLPDVVFRKKSIRESGVPLFGGILFACIIASLINPYTYHLYLLPGRVMSDVTLVRIIPELHSPDFFFTLSFEALILLLLLGFGLMKKIPFSLAEALLLFFFMHYALQHVRHLPLVGIVAAPICFRVLYDLSHTYVKDKWKNLIPWAFTGVGALIVLYTIFNQREGEPFFERNLKYFQGTGFYEENYPVNEADFIIENEFKGRMFNQINDAGYLIWRMSPEHHKVFTDSRYDIFGGKFMRHEQIIQRGYDRKVYENDKTWDEMLDYWQVNFILISADAPVNFLLEESNEWKLVYHRIPRYARSTRRGHKIYIRNIPENAELIKRSRLSFSAMTGKDWEDSSI